MITLLNSIPEWMLALLGVLLLLIAALYVWILVNWLALRQRVFELVEQNEQLKRTLAAQAPVEQLVEDARRQTRVRAMGLMSPLELAQEPARETAQAAARDAALADAQAEKQAAQAASRALQNQLDQTRSQLAQTHRAVQLRQVALDEAHRRLITYEGTIANLQADLQAARQAEAERQTALRAFANTTVLEQAEPVDVDLQLDPEDGRADDLADLDEEPRDTAHMISASFAAAESDVAQPAAAQSAAALPTDLAAQLDAATDLIQARDAQVAELEAQLAELQAQLNQAEDEANRAGMAWDEQHWTQAAVEPTGPDAADATAVAPLLAAEVVDEAGLDTDTAPVALQAALQPAAQMAADLELVQDALTLAQEAVQQRDATIDELKTHLGNVRTSLEMTREALQAREMEVAQLKAAPADLEQQLAALQKELGGYQQAAEQANFMLAERITTISELNRELDAQEAQLNDALARLDAQNATIADLLSDVKAANEMVSLQQSQYDNASAQMTELQTRAEAADAAQAASAAEWEAGRGELAQQLQAAQDMHRELSDQIGSVRARVAELETQLQQSQAEAEAANAKLASRSKRIDTLKTQLEAAQAGLAARASSPPPAEPAAGSRANGLAEMNLPPAATTSTAETTPDAGMTPAAPPVARGFGRRKVEAEVAPATALAPDQDALTDIVGIGAIHARRLIEAGITTYKALAKSKRSQLEKIIQPTKLQNIDFDSWIEQAKAKAKAAKR